MICVKTAPNSRRSCPAHAEPLYNFRRLNAIAADLEAAGFGRAVAVLLARHEARATPVTVVMEAAHAAE